MIIRAKTFNRWMQANFCSSALKDMAHYGANTGWSGLTYYTDTCKLYAKFKEEIWQMLAEDAWDFGLTPLELIASFNGASEVETATHLENLLTWYAAERIARQLT